MQATARFLNAIADPVRLGALRLLWDGREYCGCELIRKLGVTQSRLSRHLAQLKAAGLVIDRRDAQWVRYRRNPALSREASRLVDAALAHSRTSSGATRERRAA